MEQARAIAGYSQFTDDNPYSWPMDPDHPTSYDERQARDFHFYGCTPDTPTKRNPDALRKVVRKRFEEFVLGHSFLIQNRSDARLGAVLHIYADSWAHEGFTAWRNKLNRRTGGFYPNIGHADAPEGGKAPDRPYNDTAKAMEAALAILDLIPEIQNPNSPLLNRTTICNDLKAQFAVRGKGDLDTRIRAIQALITSRFGDRLSDFKYSKDDYSTDYFKGSVSRDNAHGGLPPQPLPASEWLK